MVRAGLAWVVKCWLWAGGPAGLLLEVSCGSRNVRINEAGERATLPSNLCSCRYIYFHIPPPTNISYLVPMQAAPGQPATVALHAGTSVRYHRSFGHSYSFSISSLSSRRPRIPPIQSNVSFLHPQHPTLPSTASLPHTPLTQVST
ncbi:hypothetical protein IWX49DRAFT_56251 [Phyllosticta citricarpa]|uniref:Secreted protein n=1 Tax=Phyllosticta citricarpa TaxID=55181 RepID=A0ABR1MPA9_9PEZI